MTRTPSTTAEAVRSRGRRAAAKAAGSAAAAETADLRAWLARVQDAHRLALEDAAGLLARLGRAQRQLDAVRAAAILDSTEVDTTPSVF